MFPSITQYPFITNEEVKADSPEIYTGTAFNITMQIHSKLSLVKI